MKEPVRNAVRKRLDEGLRAHTVPTFFQKHSEKRLKQNKEVEGLKPQYLQ